MRKKLLMFTLAIVATTAATLSVPKNAEATTCNKTCCGNLSCSCCNIHCQCPIPSARRF